MIAYRIASYRPYAPLYTGKVLGQTAAPAPQETFPNSSILVGVLNSAILSGVAWIGVRSGMREKGWISGVGWTIGVLAGIGGVFTLGMTTGMLVNAVFPKSNA